MCAVADVADCALSNVFNSSALSDVDRLHDGLPAVAPVSALPGAYRLRATRGRNVSVSVPVAADCALPSEMKSRRGRTAKVPAAVDCAFPGVGNSSSAEVA